MKKGLMILALVALVASMVAPVFAADPADTEVTGMVEKGEHGLMLKAADAEYAVTGTAVTEEMVGKNVKATGVVTEKDGKKSIEVKTVEEVK